MRACAVGDCLHWSLRHSSPPTWMNGDVSAGNSSSSSSKTPSKKRRVLSVGASTFGLMPQVSHTESAEVSMTSVLPSSGYALMAACEWPGMSISGTTRICRSAAYATISRMSSCV